MNKVIKNEQNFIDEDTYWKNRRDEVSGGNEGLGEILSFEIKGGGWDLIPRKESKSDDGRAGIYPSIFTNTRFWTKIEFSNVVKCR